VHAGAGRIGDNNIRPTVQGKELVVADVNYIAAVEMGMV
jgi:hypothetical protein